MKIFLFVSVVFYALTSFSQSCVSAYMGTYRVDIENTMPFFIEKEYAENGALPDDFRSMVEGITLVIFSDSLSLEMMGNYRVLTFTDRKSIKENGSCDLLLDMSDMAVPEKANEMFLTIYEKKKKRLQIINSVDPKEMDSYIWLKTP